LQGHLPPDALHAFRSFLEFYYIVRREVITEDDLDKLQDAISSFHSYRQVFSSIRGEKGFSLPRQHSIVHYPDLIRLFGAPNGLCSSITESKHIRAVKEPWRRSNRNNALYQMLTTNQRLDQLAAARVDFTTRGMLKGTLMASALVASAYDYFPSVLMLIVFSDLYSDEGENEPLLDQNTVTSIADEAVQDAIVVDDILAEVKLPKTSRKYLTTYFIIVQFIIVVSGYKWALDTAVRMLKLPDFPQLIRRFLYDQTYLNAQIPSFQVSIDVCSVFVGKISVF
jgi:hypothetical protein